MEKVEILGTICHVARDTAEANQFCKENPTEKHLDGLVPSDVWLYASIVLDRREVIIMWRARFRFRPNGDGNISRDPTEEKTSEKGF